LKGITEGQRKEEGWSKKEQLSSFLLKEEAQHGLVCSAEASMWWRKERFFSFFRLYRSSRGRVVCWLALGPVEAVCLLPSDDEML